MVVTSGGAVGAQRRSAGAGELYLLPDTELARAIREAHHLVERLYGERLAARHGRRAPKRTTGAIPRARGS